MDATTAGSSFHDSVLPIVGLLGGLWCTWRYWKAAHAYATRRNEVWAKLSHLFGAIVGVMAFVFWYVVLTITFYPAHWGRLWLPWGFSVVTMVVAWRWLNSNKRYAPAMGIGTPAPTPVSTDAPAPAVQMRVDVPSLGKAFVPTPEQLAQIEESRQSSLRTLREREAKAKAAAKALKKTASKVVEPSIDAIDLPDRVEINYRKSDGSMDRRVVKVNQVDRISDKFTGFCERAGAVRTFKVSGIQGLVTRLETGEMVKPMIWFSAIKSPENGKARSRTKQSAKKDWAPAVALLGFHQARYEQLAFQAEAAGMQARFRLSDSVMYVVFGPNAGAKQRAHAEEIGAIELSENEI